MKAKIVPITGILIALLLISDSCEETVYKIFTGNSPIYMSYEDLRVPITTQQDADLENPGKIYFKDSYIFIVEELKGIHVFDNANPSSPVKKAFVKIPGVVDISISGNILYADSYVDLVVLDLQDINNIKEAGRIEDLLPYAVPPVDNDYPLASIDKDQGVVVGWEVKKIRERDHDAYYGPMPFYREEMDKSGISGGLSGSGIGTGGSMARFCIKDNALYIMADYTVKVMNISSRLNPVNTGMDFYMPSNSETMFLSDKYMFIGTATGMLVFDISNPFAPQQKMFFTHARACDPVVVDDTLAYITLRTGTTCGGVSNMLSVVNIKDIDNPKLVMTYPLTNPHGLGKDGDLLFICDGSAGLKIFDSSDPKTITSNLIKDYPDINAYDVIPVGGLLILIGDDGLYQYDYSDMMNISLVSSILAQSRK